MRAVATDIDDVEELISADTEGLLHASAMAGAQVRAVAEAQREGVLAPLADLRPRSVVLVTGSSPTAGAATELACLLLGPRLDVPVLSVSVLPGWIGPLDVVVIVGADAGDIALSDAAARALRRRAELVVVAPVEGPIREAVSGRWIDLSPRLDVDARFAMTGQVAAIVATLTALTAVRLTGRAPDLAELADAIDAEASRNHPSSESFRNRAKSLAEAITGRPAVFTGDTSATTAIARHCAWMIYAVAGIVCSAADMPTAVAAESDRGRRSGQSPTDSIFYDPDFDGPAILAPKVFAVGSPGREWYIRQRIAGLGEVELLSGDESAVEAAEGEAGDVARFSSPVELLTNTTDDLGPLLVQLVRVEMASVYLRLVGA